MDENLRRGLEAAGLTLAEYDGFTDELITDHEIDLLQKHGIKRPPNVRVARWNQPRVLTPRHKKIIHLAAMGKTTKQIAEEVGMNSETISTLIHSPLFKQKISKAQDSIFNDNARAYVDVLMNKAFGVIEGILEDHDEKSSIRLEAAKFVIDHKIGKAKQTVEHEGSSLLVQFITKLDDERVVKQIQNTPIEPEYVALEVPKEKADEAAATALKVLEKPADAMDNLVESIIGTDFVVGRRDTNGSQS